MKFVVHVPDSERERIIALGAGINEQRMPHINIEEKILVLMSMVLQGHGSLCVPLDHEQFQDLQSLKGIDYERNMIVVGLLDAPPAIQDGYCSHCMGKGEINNQMCASCRGTGRV